MEPAIDGTEESIPAMNIGADARIFFHQAKSLSALRTGSNDAKNAKSYQRSFDVWKKIKPYLVGALTAIGALLAYILGRRSTGMGGQHDGDGGKEGAGRVRDAIGDHDERTRNIKLAEQRLERMEREAQRTTTERDELESRTDSRTESGRRTISDNREFLQRLRETDPEDDSD